MSKVQMRQPARGTGEPHRGHFVYVKLCEALRQGKFAPGQKLKLREIAGQFDTSLTPAREALQRLVAQKILTSNLNSTITVFDPTAKEFLEFTRIRIDLECLATEWALENISPEQLQVISNKHDKYKQALQRHNWQQVVAANEKFHMSIYEAADMPNLLEIIQDIWLKMGPTIGQYLSKKGFIESRELTDTHDDLIDALSSKNKRAAQKAVKQDIETLAQYIYRIKNMSD
ncbi:MAG: GntR family transcriptional regulator [Pseudomonadota bacterium]